MTAPTGPFIVGQLQRADSQDGYPLADVNQLLGGVKDVATAAALPALTNLRPMNLAIAEDTGIIYQYVSGSYVPLPKASLPNVGAGSVTSVALTVPPWLTAGGSPITTSGTLAVTATAGQTANQFLATPNGSTGAVGLRAIVAADVPTLNQNTTGNAATATAAAALLSATTTVVVNGATAPTSGQVLTASSGTAASWQTPSAGFTNPMTTVGDLIVGGASGAPTRLAQGGNSTFLGVSGGVLGYYTVPAGGVTTLAAVGSAPNANAATISGSTLNLQPYDAAHPGVLTTGAQVAAGAKTFQNITSQGTGAAATTSTFYGTVAASATSLATFDTAVGYNSMAALLNGSSNTALGANTLSTMTNASDNTAVGYFVLNVCTGSNNTAVGANCATDITSGGGNTIVGVSAGESLTTPNANTLVGWNALLSSVTGTNNTVVGANAGDNLDDSVSPASNNVLIGYNVATAPVNLTSCTLVGTAATAPNTATNAGAFGNGATATASNQLMLGNSSVTDILGAGTSLNLFNATATTIHFAGAASTLNIGAVAGATTFAGTIAATNLSGTNTGDLPVIVNAQTGATYTFVSGDKGKLVTHSNASAIADTLPQATGSFGSGWFVYVENRGAGTLTITPTTSTIDGAATLALTTNQGCLIASDGTNYFTMRGAAFGLSIASGKTLTVSNTLTLAGTDSTTMTFPPASANIGYLEVPSNTQSAAYTTVLADSGKCIVHPASDANARTFTIDSHTNVAWVDGACISFENWTSQVVTIAITTDTMYLAGTGTTGSRSLAQYGIATARYTLATNSWLISGTGLT